MLAGKSLAKSDSGLESKPQTLTGKADMGVIFLEALTAVLIVIFIVWWTMFSGRKSGERHDDNKPK